MRMCIFIFPLPKAFHQTKPQHEVGLNFRGVFPEHVGFFVSYFQTDASICCKREIPHWCVVALRVVTVDSCRLPVWNTSCLSTNQRRNLGQCPTFHTCMSSCICTKVQQNNCRFHIPNELFTQDEEQLAEYNTQMYTAIIPNIVRIRSGHTARKQQQRNWRQNLRATVWTGPNDPTSTRSDHTNLCKWQKQS